MAKNSVALISRGCENKLSSQKTTYEIQRLKIIWIQ